MINGFVVIDKPPGITSHDVVSRVRRILNTRKVGHTGTLDPFATGVLPIAVNDGTKAIPFLDEGVKCYEAVMQLGAATDTLDMTGTVLRQGDWQSITRDDIEAALKRFTGRLSQIPPMYSAIKLDGQPLYKLARHGQTVERKPREIDIASLELISFLPPFAGFRVVCSRGTYVRTLADDIGSVLGCGAALKELRRLASGPFSISNSITLEGLEESVRSGTVESLAVKPTSALNHLAEIQLTEPDVTLIKHGRSPKVDFSCIPAMKRADGEILVRLSWNGELAAVAHYVTGKDTEPRIILKRVFM